MEASAGGLRSRPDLDEQSRLAIEIDDRPDTPLAGAGEEGLKGPVDVDRVST